jgi:hypothetical protein
MEDTNEAFKGGWQVAMNTLRESIQSWQERLQLAGMGLVETALEPRATAGCAPMLLNCHGASIDATLEHLSRRTSGQFTVELAYPWRHEEDQAGALLGFAADPADEATCTWPAVDAA